MGYADGGDLQGCHETSGSFTTKKEKQTAAIISHLCEWTGKDKGTGGPHQANGIGGPAVHKEKKGRGNKNPVQRRTLKKIAGSLPLPLEI